MTWISTRIKRSFADIEISKPWRVFPLLLHLLFICLSSSHPFNPPLIQNRNYRTIAYEATSTFLLDTVRCSLKTPAEFARFRELHERSSSLYSDDSIVRTCGSSPWKGRQQWYTCGIVARKKRDGRVPVHGVSCLHVRGRGWGV